MGCGASSPTTAATLVSSPQPAPPEHDSSSAARYTAASADAEDDGVMMLPSSLELTSAQVEQQQQQQQRAQRDQHRSHSSSSSSSSVSAKTGERVRGEHASPVRAQPAVRTASPAIMITSDDGDLSLSPYSPQHATVYAEAYSQSVQQQQTTPTTTTVVVEAAASPLSSPQRDPVSLAGQDQYRESAHGGVHEGASAPQPHEQRGQELRGGGTAGAVHGGVDDMPPAGVRVASTPPPIAPASPTSPERVSPRGPVAPRVGGAHSRVRVSP